MGFELDGEPDAIIAAVTQRVRELQHYLPEGEKRLVIKATIRHASASRRKRRGSD